MVKQRVATSLSTALSAGCERRGSAQLPVFPAPECLAGVCGALGELLVISCSLAESLIWGFIIFSTWDPWRGFSGLVLSAGHYTDSSALV